MNYRHAFHAGNFADVVKHVLLTCLLRRLTEKPKPICYVETHAGRGLYDLQSDEAVRSGEAGRGILRALEASPDKGIVADYLRLVRGANDHGTIKTYPGSPALAAAILRPDDRAILCELDPGEAKALKSLFRTDRRVAVRVEDGYQALAAVLPPSPRRGLVMIDPPYESPTEIDSLLDGLRVGLGRWTTGIFLAWYPIKERGEFLGLRRRLNGLAVPWLAVEFCVTPDDTPSRLNGSGMAIFRPPWRIEEALQDACRQLEIVLCGGHAFRAELVRSDVPSHGRDLPAGGPGREPPARSRRNRGMP